MSENHDLPALLDHLLTRARAHGADAADAVAITGTSLSVRERLGALETMERAEGHDLGLRVFVGQRAATVSTGETTAEALEAVVERAVAMARTVPEDPHAGLADPHRLAQELVDLDMCDPVEPDPAVLETLVRTAEEAARAVPGVTNSEGAEAGWSRTQVALATSTGFARVYARTGCSLATSVVAGEGTAMESDYDATAATHLADLRAAAEVGRSAGERAVARLNPRKVSTRRVPVVFDPRVARSLMGHLAGAINGAAIARGTSFLKDALEQPVFAPGITVLDDPLRPRGPRSRPFDGEGVAVARREIIRDGVLTSWLLDSRSARQLGLATTGHASRGTSSPPSPGPSNFLLANGTLSPDVLMADITEGLYVTTLFGQGVNMVTGDYSRGAAGFWIENGALASPVSEITIAGQLRDMFRSLTPANDLVLRWGTDSPTVRVEGMTVAGN